MPVPRRVVVPLLVSVLLVTGCGTAADSGSPADQPDPAAELGLVVDLDPADVQAVGAGVNAFGFDLLRELTDGTENTVTSPLSAATLLAMVLAGTGGDTADEMAEVLYLDDPRDVRVGALLDAIADTDDVTLSVANALWGHHEIPFEESYLDFVQGTFDATYEEADPGDQATADAIDAWADQRTQGRIPKIAEELGLPNPDTAMVLLNAVYFLGTWTTEFDPGDTRKEPFTLPEGGQAQVPLMHLRGQKLEYAGLDGYQMLRLPYGEEGRYGMEVLLPDLDVGLPGLLETLDQAEWRDATGALAEQTVDEVALPQFTLSWGKQLNAPLQQLGMSTVFEPGVADFTPMSPAELFLDVVAQKTFIQVDEAGTEAAAVTGGAVGTTSAKPLLRFQVDRPFAFTISDRETGTILFLGAVTDPRG